MLAQRKEVGPFAPRGLRGKGPFSSGGPPEGLRHQRERQPLGPAQHLKRDALADLASPPVRLTAVRNGSTCGRALARSPHKSRSYPGDG